MKQLLDAGQRLLSCSYLLPSQEEGNQGLQNEDILSPAQPAITSGIQESKKKTVPEGALRDQNAQRFIENWRLTITFTSQETEAQRGKDLFEVPELFVLELRLGTRSPDCFLGSSFRSISPPYHQVFWGLSCSFCSSLSCLTKEAGRQSQTALGMSPG